MGFHKRKYINEIDIKEAIKMIKWWVDDVVEMMAQLPLPLL